MPGTLLSIEQARTFLRDGTGRGVKIAVMDSGVDVTHPCLAGLELADDIAVVEHGHSLAVVEGCGTDLYGHGTAITHLIRRLAPEATIGSIRVLGERLNSRTAIIEEGARQALDRGYHILNCSFGCGIAEHVLKYKSWIDDAYLKGVHIVSACNNIDFSRPEWPGHFATVLTANFCRGMQNPAPEAFYYYRHGNLVEFAAPAEEIDVPWLNGGQKKVTGSSYAAPQIAALLARLLSLAPALEPLEAKALMHQLAKPWSDKIAATNAQSLFE